MTDPRDELPAELHAELRRAWRADAPLPRALDTGALEDCDAATRASVKWLQVAHQTREARRAPAGVPPAVQLAHARARGRAKRRLLRLPASVAGGLAAAAVLLILARVLVVAPRPDAEPVHVADTGTSPVEAPAPRAPRNTDIPPERFRSREDGIELVSGNVRLVLLTPTTPNPNRGEER